MRKDLSGIIDPTKSLRALERLTITSPTLQEPDLLHSLNKAKIKYQTSSRLRIKPTTYYHNDIEKLEKSQVDRRAMQQLTSERLWKGKVLKEPNIPKIADLESEYKIKLFKSTLLVEQESKVNFFLNNLTAFKKMKNLLLLNFKICKMEEVGNESSVDGLLLELNEKLEKIEKTNKIDQNELVENFISLNTSFRELIRILKVKMEPKAAETLETLWRIIVKLVDNAVYTHFLCTDEFSEILQSENREIFREKTEELSSLKKEFSDELQKVTSENETLKKNLIVTKGELEKVKSALIVKKDELKNLLKFENRDKDMEKLKKLLQDFDTFIEDTQREKVRQIIVLNSVANLINSAEDLSLSRIKIDKTIQTDAYNLEVINYESTYEEYLSVFGTSFGEAGSMSSINAFVSLIRRDLEPKEKKRSSLKKKLKVVKSP